MIQLAITGTNVCDKKYDVIMENAIAMANGRNNAPGMPVMVNAGANTASMHNNMSSFLKPKLTFNS